MTKRVFNAQNISYSCVGSAVERQHACARKKDVISLEMRSSGSTKQAKMQLLLGVIGDNQQLKDIAQLLSQDFSCALQQKTGFDVTVTAYAKKPTPRDIYQTFVHQGYPFELLIVATGAQTFEWQLWDSLQATMLKRNRVSYEPEKLAYVVHGCADEIWKELTGQEGIFSTVIAYCKQVKGSKRDARHVYVANAQGQNSHCLVDTESNKLALRWHTSGQAPTLFYSEHTPVNVRLVSTPLFKQNKNTVQTLISNFNGLNMQPSFADNGKKSVMCASFLGSSQLYYGTVLDNQQWKFHRITYNNGNNIAPILRDNGDIIFCSDFEFNRPQIYYYHADKGSVERITSGTYTASPAWCERKEMLAYVKNVQGVMQLFAYNRKTQDHTQLTFDAHHKEEPTWSPEGSYIAYSSGSDLVNRIVVRNMVTLEEFYVSADNEYCCYPAWSPQIRV